MKRSDEQPLISADIYARLCNCDGDWHVTIPGIENTFIVQIDDVEEFRQEERGRFAAELKAEALDRTTTNASGYDPLAKTVSVRDIDRLTLRKEEK